MKLYTRVEFPTRKPATALLLTGIGKGGMRDFVCGGEGASASEAGCGAPQADESSDSDSAVARIAMAHRRKWVGGVFIGRLCIRNAPGGDGSGFSKCRLTRKTARNRP
jgi:hypothetical protein